MSFAAGDSVWDASAVLPPMNVATKSPTWSSKKMGGVRSLTCEKRPVPMSRLAEMVDEVEVHLAESLDREMSTTEVGEMLMDKLKTLDKIAYVRFASVYRDFQDVEAFLNELKQLVMQKRS
jgi:transcriptional regulator NrdR family protein